MPNMDKRLAALKPSIADHVQWERTTESLLRLPPVPVDPFEERPPRAAFLRVADSIRSEADSELAKNADFAEKAFS